MAQIEFAGHDVIELRALETIGRFGPGNDSEIGRNSFPFRRQNRQLTDAKNSFFFARVLLEPVDRADSSVDMRHPGSKISGAGPTERQADESDQNWGDP